MNFSILRNQNRGATLMKFKFSDDIECCADNSPKPTLYFEKFKIEAQL